MADDWSRRKLLRTGLRAGAAMALVTALPGCGGGAAADDDGDNNATTPDAAGGPDGNGAGPDAAPPQVYGPRPYYIVGHNPNTLDEVLIALNAGANGLEPDINIYSDDPNALCISHGEGDSSAPTLVRYLTDLHQIALDRPALALIVFDCKPGTASPEKGATILAAIREHLTYDTNLNVIISVSTFDQASMFDLIKDDLGPREGLMIDEDNDPALVADYFATNGVVNQGYGNGISVLTCGILGPNVRPAMEQACALRATTNRPRFVYVWTVNCKDLEHEYINIGVDGMITDDPAEVRAVVEQPQYADVVRIATRADNPFAPANFTYGLTIKTGDVSMAGTDANVTFTLTGSLGTAVKTIDTSYIKRMETNDTNYVTIAAPDLGVLQTITVQHDGSGNGPGWYLEWIQVASARYGVSAQATFGEWIYDPDLYTRDLA